MSCWHKARDDVSGMAWVLPKDLQAREGWSHSGIEIGSRLRVRNAETSGETMASGGTLCTTHQ
jgi:hypothetical protein